MAHKGKWIDGTEPHDRLTKAARRALRTRLEMVWHHLPRAAKSDATDPDPIHQLRVSTRRAWAALECYREVLPAGPGRRVRKQLKAIRKAAGDARDFDVLSLRLQGEPSTGDPDWQLLLARIGQCRQEAREPVVALWHRLRDKHFQRRIGELVKRVRWHGSCDDGDEPTFAVAARDRLREVADAFFIASSGDLSDIAFLHEFRILGKQLRYAMELYHGAFGKEFRGELYPQIEEVQEKIGATIDHAAAIKSYEDWLAHWSEPRLAVPLEHLLERERGALIASRDAFTQWWTPERAKQLQRDFDEALTRPFVERVA